MFPFVSSSSTVLPSKSIVIRRWHRRRSRKSHDSCSSNIFHSIYAKSQHLQHITFYFTLALVFTLTHGRTAFEKMTDLDFVGETYYTIRNLSLYECQGWCREEPECNAASFSFAVNPTSSPPRQETVCLLQNGTQATNPSAKPLRALNQYYMVKMSVRSDKVCKRPWNFERVPNSMIQGHDRALIFTSTKEACLAACLNEKNFICRSAEYNYVTLQCRLSDYDRRSVSENFQSVQLIEAQGVDYFENLCLTSNGACEKSRKYATPSFGIPEQKVALHVGVHYYIDKELMANSETACERACSLESEFLCRSYLYLGPPTGIDYNCKLYHLDHWTLPDGISAFLNSQTPLVGDGSRLGKYYENRCEKPYIVNGVKQPKSFDPALEKDIMGKNGYRSSDADDDGDDTMLCKRVVTKDRRYITQITCFEKGSIGKDKKETFSSNRNALRLPVFGKQQNGGALASLFSFPRRQLFGGDGGSNAGTGGGFTPSLGGQIGIGGNNPFNPGGLNPGGGSNGGSILIPGGSNGGNRPFGPGSSSGGSSSGGANTGGGNNQFGQGGSSPGSNGGGNFPFGPGGVSTGDNTVGGGGVNVIGGGGSSSNPDIDFGDPDVNCDNQGTCYDVTVHCKDTRIVVNVGTNRPFSGRIYALGRSETCNVDVISSDSFRLDLTMTGQDCNTQSVNGIYTNTVVVQRHSVVMTKTDKIYKVRCTYDTSSRNVTFGMMPIRDPDMISITSAPEAPAPRISILDSSGKEVETVRIGDQLTFKIEIPDKTPYGIFARSCIAMAKDSRSTFGIIDENGCPMDPTIFPRFTPDGAALVSQYEAFRFTESYGVIFQCNVKYCLGPCPPTNCQYGRESFDSWGRRKRRAVEDDGRYDLGETQMRLSHEIIVLDYGDEQTSPFDFDKPIMQQQRKKNDNATDYHATPMDWKKQQVSEQAYDSSEPGTVNAIECPTSRNSVLALAVTCSLLVILYVVTVMCMCYRKAVLCSDDDDDRCSTSTTKSTMLPEAILSGLPTPVLTHGGERYISDRRDYMR